MQWINFLYFEIGGVKFTGVYTSYAMNQLLFFEIGEVTFTGVYTSYAMNHILYTAWLSIKTYLHQFQCLCCMNICIHQSCARNTVVFVNDYDSLYVRIRDENFDESERLFLPFLGENTFKCSFTIFVHVRRCLQIRREVKKFDVIM